MLYLRLAKFLSSILVLIAATLFASQVVTAKAGDEGIRADLPLSGILFVENSRGNVHIEVWNEQYVSVENTVRGEKPKGAPVSIVRTDGSLKIIVSSQQVGMLTRVDLTLRIPERTHAQITAARGDISISGAPAELIAETVSGNIRASFSQASGVKVTAEAATGNTSFENCAPPSGREDIYKVCRMGAGERPVTLRSERGHIFVTSSDARESSQMTGQARKTPILLGAEKNKAGVGTPATPLTSPEEVDEGDVVRVDTELVTLNVSVIDRSTNRGLKGLKESDFKLFEDSKPQELVHFESANAPFNLILLIDLSTSTQEKIGLVREAALRFVNAARPADRIGIITFANTPIIASPLTSDRAALRERINAIEQPKGSTKLYDALDFAMNQVLKDSKDSRRNAIVLMSDGLDSVLPNVDGEGSTLDYKELLGRVREFDGVLYTLWLDTTYEPLSALDIQEETFDLAYDRMEEMAEAGGGIFYEVDKLEDLADAYERVVADLGTVYSLSYRPTNRERNGKWRAIRVAVAQPNAVARGKRGYYAN